MRSKFKDIAASIQVIGCVYNHPHLLEQQDKYTFHPKDFTEDLHKVVFEAIYNLKANGAKKISVTDILNYLANRPSFEAVFKANKGEEWLLKASESANVQQFDYYYKRLRKMSLLRVYEEFGINLDFLYDPDNLTDLKKKQQQEDWIDNSSLEDISNTITDKLSEIREIFVDNTNNDGAQAGDGIFELIERLKETPEVGAPLYGNLINTITRGARLKKFYLRSAASGVGKAIPDSTLIPTPIGWRKVGDINQGDYLFGQNGKPTRVVRTHPQPEEKEIWEVEFADGRIAECCEEHLWEYRCQTHRGHTYRVESIKEIYNRTLELKNGLRTSDNNGYRFSVKANKPVVYSEKKYPIDPYIMGLLLGDGSFRYNKTNKALTFSSEDNELPNAIAKSFRVKAKKSSGHNYSYTFGEQGRNIWVEEILKDFPKLWNCKSEDKFIPEEYLLGSVEQRFALLQGLLDTDGSISKTGGRVSFSTVSPHLRDGIVEVCRSLGIIITISTDNREDRNPCFIVRIQCAKDVKPKLFRLARKREIALAYAATDSRECSNDHVAIVDIRRTAVKTKMTCFTVDNEDHLFLMNDFITTHNTRSMVADACYTACDKIYNESLGGWESIGAKMPALFITTEQELEEIQTMMLAFVSCVNEEVILTGKYTEDEYARVAEAANILKNSPIYIEELPDFSMQDIENVIRKNIREYDVEYVFFDYIHSSMKIFSEISQRSGGISLREDQILLMMAIRFKDLCNELGIFIMSATQLNGQINGHNTSYLA